MTVAPQQAAQAFFLDTARGWGMSRAFSSTTDLRASEIGRFSDGTFTAQLLAPASTKFPAFVRARRPGRVIQSSLQAAGQPRCVPLAIEAIEYEGSAGAMRHYERRISTEYLGRA
jgi:hypothetical protein